MNLNYQSLSNIEKNEIYEAISKESIVLPYKDALQMFHFCTPKNEKVANAWENFKRYRENDIDEFNENSEILLNTSIDKISGEIHFFTLHGISKQIAMVTFNLSKNKFLPITENLIFTNFGDVKNADFSLDTQENLFQINLCYDKNFKTIDRIWNNFLINLSYKHDFGDKNYLNTIISKDFGPMPPQFEENKVSNLDNFVAKNKREYTHLATDDLLQKPKPYSLKKARMEYGS